MSNLTRPAYPARRHSRFDSMTLTIVLNLLLGIALVAALLFLLGHYGANKDREHRHRLFRWHRHRETNPAR
jgi:hypothetical protein